jgi:hypothetical protein
MGKLLCICGNILSDTCGCDGEAFTEDQMIKTDLNETDGFEDEVYIAGDGRSIFECEKCGALAIEDPINSPMVKFYQPENGKFNKLFRTD